MATCGFQQEVEMEVPDGTLLIRPCLILSPDEMNAHIGTVIIAPMTSKGRPYPTRVSCSFQRVQGQIVLDQLRTVDKRRLVKRLGRTSANTQEKVPRKARRAFRGIESIPIRKF